ncbi:MAG: asparaginase domain-containing protein [Bacteroidota bacterium]
MKITFIQTGGTIDKDYPKTMKGYAFEFGVPATQRILEKIHPPFDYNIITAFQKDSLAITDDDRQELVDLILKQDTSNIIITHGTDTLVMSARFIFSQIKNKVIVLTGAMRPERFTNSDADLNLGGAIVAVQTLPNGVYIVMNGIVAAFDKIQRNLETGQFY